MAITLYEYAQSRSARVKWTLLELSIEHESHSGRVLIGFDELRAISPLGKLPAITDNGRPLFESAAICTWLADSHPEKKLNWPSGGWERALHDQWVSFALTEVEAHLWSTLRNKSLYPEKLRVPEIIDQNKMEVMRSLPALDAHFSSHDFLIGDKFSVTDIIVGFTINWAHKAGALENFDYLRAYNKRLLEFPLCPYYKE